MVGPQQKPIALADAVVESFLQVFLGDGLARHLVAKVGDYGVTHEQLKRELMDLRTAAHVVLWRINVAAGVQAHMHAAHDLTRAPGASCSLRTSISNCMSFLNPAGVRIE